jgi:hypothetical protein
MREREIGERNKCHEDRRKVRKEGQDNLVYCEICLSPGVKQLCREVDHSPPSSVEVKKTWIYTSTPLYVFMS